MNPMQGLLVGTAIAGILAGSAGAVYAAGLGVRKLAENDIFFTFVEEGTAKAFLKNGKFQKLEMSLEGHCFVNDLRLPSDTDLVQYVADCLPGLSDNLEERREQARMLNHPWLIIKPADPNHLPQENSTPLSSVFGGIKWVGFYPFSQIHTYEFTWSRIKQRDNTNAGDPNKLAQIKMEDQLKLWVKTTGETLDNILIRDYTYVGVVTAAETKGGIPVDILFVLTIQIENPYKALFGIFKWLETILDQMGARLRDYVGDYSYEEVIQHEFDREVLEKKLSNRLGIIRREYGAYIKIIQATSIDPGSELATQFRDATTREKIAQIDANVVRIGADAERYRIREEYTEIGQHAHGPTIKTAEAVRDSKLTTLVTGSSNILPSIDVGPRNPLQPPSNSPDSSSEESGDKR